MLLGWFARQVWLASIQGGFMAGLTPGRGSGGGSSAMMDPAISECCLVPILALWLPGRLLLGASAVILLPVTLISRFLRSVPFLGLSLLVTVFTWYATAISKWRLLKPSAAPPIAG